MKHGRHVKIVGKGSPELLRSVTGMKSMLAIMIDRLGMRMLDVAHMYEVEEELDKLGVEPFEDEGGVTGIAVLSTSHCAVHTWPLRGHFVMDVYSCRDFDASEAVRVVEDSLGAYALRVTDLTHALEPAEEEETSALAERLPATV